MSARPSTICELQIVDPSAIEDSWEKNKTYLFFSLLDAQTRGELDEVVIDARNNRRNRWGALLAPRTWVSNVYPNHDRLLFPEPLHRIFIELWKAELGQPRTLE